MLKLSRTRGVYEAKERIAFVFGEPLSSDVKPHSQVRAPPVSPTPAGAPPPVQEEQVARQRTKKTNQLCLIQHLSFV